MLHFGNVDKSKSLLTSSAKEGLWKWAPSFNFFYRTTLLYLLKPSIWPQLSYLWNYSRCLWVGMATQHCIKNDIDEQHVQQYWAHLFTNWPRDKLWVMHRLECYLRFKNDPDCDGILRQILKWRSRRILTILEPIYIARQGFLVALEPVLKLDL